MAAAIVSHSEVLVSIWGGSTTVKRIAADLAVSTSTARKYAEELVERGWLARREEREVQGGRTIRFTGYWLTQRGQSAHENDEQF